MHKRSLRISRNSARIDADARTSRSNFNRHLHCAVPGASTGHTALTVVFGLLGVAALPEESRAQCVPAGGSNYTCSGANTTTQAIAANNAAVTTAPGFSVDTGGGGFGVALQISGNGAISYTDANASTLNSSGSVGLVVHAAGDDAGTPGGVTINTNANISGSSGGISATNYGTGAIDITATGLMQGGAYAVYATNEATGTDITVNAGSASNAGVGVFAQNLGTGSTSVTTTGPLLTSRGVFAYNSGTSLTVTTGIVTAAFGGREGIEAVNLGTGATNVTANGAVTGSFYHGIIAANGIVVSPDRMITSVSGDAGTDLIVSGTSVTSGGTGIFAVNSGSGGGQTSVVASGNVAGGTDHGIVAVNGAATFTDGGFTSTIASVTAGLATDLTVNAATVSGGQSGILAVNAGVGATSIAVTGDTIGTTGYGILAVNGTVTFDAAGAITGVFGGSATDLAITAVNVSGGSTGIHTANESAGGTSSVTATGTVTGLGGDGILAMVRGGVALDPTAITLTVNAAAVSGSNNGIVAQNLGFGTTTVTASGAVVGTAGDGINAYNANTALFVNAQAVSGGAGGINARNDGAGATNVMAAGTVTGGSGSGIYALTRGTDVTINAAAVSGGVNGISADNQGVGATNVTATGQVIGQTQSGILAVNLLTGTSMTVSAAGVIGTVHGIEARNLGTGSTSVTTSGLIEGGVSAISATSAGQPITITTGGLVRNMSQLSTSVAVEAIGGPATLTNGGGVIDTVQFGSAASSLANNADWNTAGGTNTFGGGASQLINAVGVRILGATNGSVLETTSFNGLGSFSNLGIVTLQDGGAGDVAHFSGNMSAGPNAVQAIDIDRAGRSDLVRVDGAATITGTTLNVVNQGGYAAGRYAVLTATGGLTGTYSSVTGDVGQVSAFLNVTDTYDANNAYLTAAKFRNFADAGLTPNQISTARGLDTIPSTGQLFNAVAGLATDAQARAAFDLLSGEQHAFTKTALIEDSRFLRAASIDRLRAAFDAVGASSSPVMAYAGDGPILVPATANRFILWAQGFGSWGHTDSDGNAAHLSRSTGGFLVGGDAPIFDTWRLGLHGGYSRTSFDVKDRASSGSSDNYHLGLYAGTQWGNLGFRAGAAYTGHDISSSRTVAFAGFADSLSGNYHAGTAQVFGDLGYRIAVNHVALEPFANLAYINLHTGDFAERGGGAALTSQGGDDGVTFSTLGLRASTDFALGHASATVRGALGWRHAFGDTTPFSTFAFASGAPFAIAGSAIARDAAVVEAGVDLKLFQDATFGVSYNGQFASRAQDQSFKANLAIKY